MLDNKKRLSMSDQGTTKNEKPEVGRVNNERPGEVLHKPEVGVVKNERAGEEAHEEEVGVTKNEKPGEEAHTTVR